MRYYRSSSRLGISNFGNAESNYLFKASSGSACSINCHEVFWWMVQSGRNILTGASTSNSILVNPFQRLSEALLNTNTDFPGIMDPYVDDT